MQLVHPQYAESRCRLGSQKAGADWARRALARTWDCGWTASEAATRCRRLFPFPFPASVGNRTGRRRPIRCTFAQPPIKAGKTSNRVPGKQCERVTDAWRDE